MLYTYEPDGKQVIALGHWVSKVGPPRNSTETPIDRKQFSKIEENEFH